MTDINNDNFIEESDEIIHDGEDNFNSIKEKLTQCEKEKLEYLDGWQRSKADFVNLKKRSADEVLESRERSSEYFIMDLLPVLDSFDMAFKNKEAWESAPVQWRKGIEYIYSQILSVLENNQVKLIDPLGDDFDPNTHHSAMSVAVEDPSQDGKVVEVILKGYKIKDRVIRPAHVKVGSLESHKL